LSFALFYCARIATNLGFNIVGVAIGWQVYELTNSPLALGLIGLVQFAPTFAFVIAAGHVADRYDRRLVSGASQILQALTTAAIVVGIVLRALSPELLFAAAFVLGCGRAFEAPTMQALLTNVVTRERLPSAMALSASANRVAVIAGPAVGGALYALSPPGVYALAAALYALAAVFVALTRPTREAPHRAPVTFASLFAGVAFVARDKLILGAISLDLFAVLFGGATALLPIYARDILGTGAWGLGLLRSAPAVGSLAMTFVLGRFPIRRRYGPTLFLMVTGFGVATIVFALSRSFALSFAALALAGLFDVVSVLIRQSLVLMGTPDAMRGRVTAINLLFASSSNQLGQFESGLVAQWFGAVPSAVIGGVGTIAVALLWLRLFPQLVRVDRPTETAP
jgi:MFS family permease